MARRAWCNRAHSAVTQKVNATEEGKVNVHTAFLKFASAQLLFLGLIRMGLALAWRLRLSGAGPLAHRNHHQVDEMQLGHHLTRQHKGVKVRLAHGA